MKLKMELLVGAAALALAGSGTSTAFAQSTAAVPTPQPAGKQSAAASAPGNEIAEVVVTANKRQQNVQNVGMSITAASGATLQKLGVVNTADLQKITPGFLSTPSFYGTEVYTIRGVGFQDTSLAGSPTVSTYIDEFPLPYAALTPGASLDLQRVEVLKGPQGTLFGENATGGAVNYIANKPTDHLEYGGSLSVGRFDSILADGYISGPLTDTLSARLALQSDTSAPWQKGYGPQAGLTNGSKDFTNGRLSLLWKPTNRFRALLTVSGWSDRSDNQAAQLWGTAAESAGSPLAKALANYPLAPHNAQAAGWSPCINTSPFDPIAGQGSGTTYATPNGTPESEGAGSAAAAGASGTSCAPMKRDNSFVSSALRLDYDIGDGVTLTSLSEYLAYTRRAGIDSTGAPVQDAQSLQTGRISSAYQELRIGGPIKSSGSWIVGANYQHDNTLDKFLYSSAAGTDSPFPLGPGLYTGLGPSSAYNAQQTDTYAAYGNIEYPLLDNLSVIGGVRYTKQDKADQACTRDGGDGTLARLAVDFGSPVNPGPGGCFTFGANGASIVTPYHQSLDQDNVSWRIGLNYKLTSSTLLYATVSQGYKGGSFPTLTFALATSQLKPVVQESLLAYEVGFKSRLFDHQLTLNAAAFYYDYKNKQILGTTSTIFGVLSALVNVPESHVEGFEASAIWTPNWLSGLTVTPSVSYQNSRIDGCSGNAVSGCVGGNYYNTDGYGNFVKLTGQSFPSAPQWQAALDVEYDWSLGGGLDAYVGGHAAYISASTDEFDNPNPIAGEPALAVPGYTLVDLRAGVSKDNWSLQLWGRNVTNQYYWTGSYHVYDVLIRYAGMPVTYGATLSYHFR
jgi:outer membrane receptor protein involved in Fe transport